MPLNIAHLSDIHFTCDPKLVGNDPNESMRRYMLDDLTTQIGKHGPLNALVISGDIAYGGRREEFAKARSWISEICRIGGIDDGAVFLSPGNHDIDRSVLAKRSSIEDTHLAIRQLASNHQRNEQLLRRLSLDETKELLYAPLENYNEFALAYRSCFYPEGTQYAWTRPLVLDDGSLLRIRGLNTAIMCGAKDTKGLLFLGESAWDITPEAGVEYLAFAHHPPAWLLDGEEITSHFGDTVRIQLYGHEHNQRVVRGADTITLFAGAVNPHHGRDWCPGYNFIRVSVTRDNAHKREMCVSVYAREWQNKTPRQFKEYTGNASDGSHQIRFPLRQWVPKGLTTIGDSNGDASATIEAHDPPPASNPTKNPELLDVSDVIRPLFDLDRERQIAILQRLSLVGTEDLVHPHFMVLMRALERASKIGVLSQLADAIATEKNNGN